MSRPLLSIIVLSYNTKKLLRQTLTSFELASDWELIVVDNASEDGSVDMVKSDFPQATLITNKRNLGFAAANNIGIKQAHGANVLLLNSDVIASTEAFQILLDYLNAHPEVGVVTPKVSLPDGAIDLACHRGMPTPWNSLAYFAKMERLFPNSKWFAGYHRTYENFETAHAVPATAATAMLVRRSVVDAVGMLDEQFFFYAEDLDWCKRIGEAGWEIHYVPQAEVVHMKSASGKKQTSDRAAKREATFHFWETMRQFYDKHYASTYPKPVTWLVHTGITVKRWLARVW